MNKNDSDWISISQAALFLGLSRPTFNARRLATKLDERAQGNKILIRKSQLLSLYVKEVFAQAHINLVLTEGDLLKKIFVDQNTLDLRLINFIDAYGVISLLVGICALLESHDFSVYLLVNDSLAIRVLKTCGFFKELQRRFQNRIFWNDDGLPKLEDPATHAFLPLHYLAYRGQERKLLEDLQPLLQKQNFSSDTIGYIGWIVGELADNSLTHARGPCYVLLAQFGNQSKLLEIAIGDTGKGIFNSLKENPKYESLSDREAFLKAFQAKVSSWPDDKERGKGLCDLLSIAMGNSSMVRADSKNEGLLFNFSHGQHELIVKKPTTPLGGTRFCLLLIDDRFESIDRSVVDSFIKKELDKI